MTTSLTFRLFKDSDASRVSEIICRCIREVNSNDYPAHTTNELLREFTPENVSRKFQCGVGYVGELGHSGIVNVGRLSGNRIKSFFADPSFHGRGFGTQLLAYLEVEARKRGCLELHIQSSITARTFYERRGYTLMQEVTRPVGGLQYEMKKQLL